VVVQEKTKMKTKTYKFIYKHLPIILLFLIVSIVFFLNWGVIQEYKQLPSPIYGGDYYYQMGNVIHFMKGGGFIESSSLVDAMPTYLPIYSVLVAGFSNLFALTAMKGMLIFGVFLISLSFFIWYFLFKKIFKNDWLALLGSVLIVGIGNIIIKYGPFSFNIIFPFFVYALYSVFVHNRKKDFIFLSLIYSLLLFSHMAMFMGATLMIILYFLYCLILAYKENKFPGILTYFHNNYLKWLIFIGISVPLLLIYWFKPLFLYHLNMSYYDRGHMDFPDLALLSIQFITLKKTIINHFLKFSTFRNIILSLLSLMGVFFFLFFKIKKFDKVRRFVKFFVLSSFIAAFSYFITEPVISMNFVSIRIINFFVVFSCILLPIYALKTLFTLAKKKYKINKIYFNIVIFFIIIILLIVGINKFVEYKNNYQWNKVGKTEMNPLYQDLSKYLENIPQDKVVVSTKELSFVVNSISGLKSVTSRWAQSGDPFTDIPGRDLDTAIILYGNNTNRKLELIKKYNITYLYWDYYWIRSEFVFDEDGKLQNVFDPLIVLNRKEYRNQLDENGIKYIAMNTWLDPSQKKEDIRTFDILMVTQNNYANDSHPWTYDLDPYLEEVWNYDRNNVSYGKLYKFKEGLK